MSPILGAIDRLRSMPEPDPQPPRFYAHPLMAETEDGRKSLQSLEARGIQVYVMPRVGGQAFRLEQWKP